MWALDQQGTSLVRGTRLTGWVVATEVATVTVTLGDDVVASDAADDPRFDVAAAFGVGPDVGFDIDLSGLGFGTFYLCVQAKADRRMDLGCHLYTVVPPRSESPGSSLVISGAGDVYVNASWFTDDGVTNYKPLLDGLDGLFVEDDVTVVNLECTAGRGGQPASKPFNLRCPVRSLKELSREGVDVVSQANNHSLDFGDQTMLDGLMNARAAGLLPVGSGRSALEAFTPQLLEVNGWRVAVFGFTQFVEFESAYATKDHPGVANARNIQLAASAIAKWDDLVDVVVVTVHWGVEVTFELSKGQTSGAAAMVDAGADLIFGHHPHRVQKFRLVDNVPVFYSLGNFVWFDFGGPGSDSAVGQAVFRVSGKVRACKLDAQIDRPGSVILGDHRRCLTTTR